MSREPLVSVIVPCFNAGRWIAATLEAIDAQTHAAIEIVVVDDGSTDNSAEVVSRHRGRPLRLVQQANAGQTAALNRGLREASGDFIQYLDADDLLEPRKIALQLARLRQEPGCIAAAEWARFRDDPSQALFAPRATWRDMAPVDWLVANWDDGGGMMYPALWLLPRGVVESIGPWREELTLVNDTEYFTRAVLASDEVLFCPGARTYYRSGHASLSGRKTPAAWRSYFQVVDHCERMLLAREDSDRTRRAASMLWQRLAVGSYPHDRELGDAAARRARALHAAKLALEGGQAFHLAARVLGWRRARMLQKLAGRP